MGKRSGFASSIDEIKRLPLHVLNADIARCLFGWETGGSSQGRHSFFQRLVLLEKCREEVYGVEAPARRSRRLKT
jgi:hypothetical protein